MKKVEKDIEETGIKKVEEIFNQYNQNLKNTQEKMMLIREKRASSLATLEGLKKGREAMRMSLQISPKAKASEAVVKFWATGKMLKKAWKLNKKKKKKRAKVDPEIAERAAVLANLKKQIAVAKVNAQRAATIEAQKQIEK